MGDCVRAIQADSHERHHDVYVRQQSANLQHYDGFYALQGYHPRSTRDQRSLCKIRDRWDPCQVEGRQGCLRFNAAITVRVGRVEGEYNGTVTDYKIRLASLGIGAAAGGEGLLCFGIEKFPEDMRLVYIISRNNFVQPTIYSDIKIPQYPEDSLHHGFFL